MIMPVCMHVDAGMEVPMVRTQVQMEKGQLARLRKMADVEDISVSELVRRCVDRLLEEGSADERQERWKTALSAVGRFRSGRKDVSRRHDYYLAEAFRR